MSENENTHKQEALDLLNRIEGNTHERISKTRKEHKCNNCKQQIEIGDLAKVITTEKPNEYTRTGIEYKSKYYHHPRCPTNTEITMRDTITQMRKTQMDIIFTNGIPNINLSELELINLSEIPNTI